LATRRRFGGPPSNPGFAGKGRGARVRTLLETPGPKPPGSRLSNQGSTPSLVDPSACDHPTFVPAPCPSYWYPLVLKRGQLLVPLMGVPGELLERSLRALRSSRSAANRYPQV
jgi:hypothetical protein